MEYDDLSKMHRVIKIENPDVKKSIKHDEEVFDWLLFSAIVVIIVALLMLIWGLA